MYVIGTLIDFFWRGRAWRLGRWRGPGALAPRTTPQLAAAATAWLHGVVESIWLTVGPGVPTLLRLMREWDSFDVFLDAVADTPAAPFGELYGEVVGNHELLQIAFDGVRVSPFERMSQWVVHPDHPLPYRETDRHWHNFSGSIFR